MARNDPKFMLRMPAEVKETILCESQKNGRSLNAEILYRLEESLLPKTNIISGPPASLLNSILGSVEGLREEQKQMKDDMDDYMKQLDHEDAAARLKSPRDKV
jgi:hypothetical protein